MSAPKDDAAAQSARDRYPLPFHFAEMDRLRIQHEWVKGTCGGLIKAPIDYKASGLRVLDSATADGFWITDVRSILPADAEFVGFDIAPELFPPKGWTPPKVSLVTQSLLDDFPAEWTASFDLVHQRFVLPIFAPAEAEKVVARLVRCVKPGGWIQHFEPNATVVECHPDAKALRLLPKLFAVYMLDTNPSSSLVATLERNGVRNVRQQDVELGIGKAHENVELGLRGRKDVLHMYETFVTNFSADKLGISQERFDKLYADAVDEIDRFGMSVRFTITWGQK
ncbi:N-methyltransferase gliN [Lasiodiplodia hormozganensis]|uniref:N-methyltransferase gliN n=1 Tax=Lasiodiplodia hormozganensis TaxID=869390 RepID=A0AA39XQM7_9PEZI|nr:N-methyltransferase gliN [Lasiodiplodia hormozganensis]